MDFGHWIIGLIESTFDGPASLLVIHADQSGKSCRLESGINAQISLVALIDANMHSLPDIWAFRQNIETLGGRHEQQICEKERTDKKCMKLNICLYIEGANGTDICLCNVQKVQNTPTFSKLWGMK